MPATVGLGICLGAAGVGRSETLLAFYVITTVYSSYWKSKRSSRERWPH